MSVSGGWIVVASIGAVEVMKDHGICRWNYTMRSIQKHARNHVKTFSQALILSSLSFTMMSNENGHFKLNKSEETLEKIMHLGCWGPNTTRF